ncbi:ferredoxin [Sharpea azabuensis]|uniref:Ferredoxin n=1 Tax=Sharpea azabuensis TaxID=322505 RepID=A0A1H6R7L4_9FIRM|nr:ferredoxin [Sharpea azabuensis]HAJ15263.1 ferredoxin [Erysipelotrichaceae bacterium]MEE3308210.1 ferredoxin [Sharpea azabuensis]SEI49214.1 ferredoxin [Sharpea azabuensis]SFE28148.1 ferredoxin [Sharpea azabuensis]SFL11990.1 ferredoxin [Sharpea azabuensis]
MVKVNENCIGCGACNAVCPDVFDFNDEGKVENIMGEDIPEDLMDAVKEAAEGCPVEAIEL